MDFFVFYWLTINWWQLLAGLMRTLAAHDVENINWSDGSSRSWSKLAQLSFSKILTYGIKTYINDEPIFLTNYSNLHGTHYMPPGPENGRNFFGEPLGFKTTREPIRIDCCVVLLRAWQLIINKNDLLCSLIGQKKG